MNEDYVSRINRVIDHIEANLDQDLRLEELARVASFSRFHFHRLFGAMVGETLSQFIGRLRVEKAANQLLTNPKKSVTEVALDCGFSSSATFARAFKNAFGSTASQWRKQGSVPDQTKNEEQKRAVDRLRDDLVVTGPLAQPPFDVVKWTVERLSPDGLGCLVEVKTLPELHLAYVRHVGPYQGDSDLFRGLFEKLMRWAGPRGLMRPPETKILSVYHDNPDITDESKLRVSACISVPPDTAVDGEVGKLTIPAATHVMARFALSPDQYGEAWNIVYGGFLPNSGYQPDDGPAFELFAGELDDCSPEAKHVVDICLPVKPL